MYWLFWVILAVCGLVLVISVAITAACMLSSDISQRDEERLRELACRRMAQIMGDMERQEAGDDDTGKGSEG